MLIHWTSDFARCPVLFGNCVSGAAVRNSVNGVVRGCILGEVACCGGAAFPGAELRLGSELGEVKGGLQKVPGGPAVDGRRGANRAQLV